MPRGWSKAWSEVLPKGAICFAGKRAASSPPALRSSLQACWPTSATPTVSRNAVALLSGYREPAPDPPSTDWLGHLSDRERVRRLGLWNNNHVDEDYAPSFLGIGEDWAGTA